MLNILKLTSIGLTGTSLKLIGGDNDYGKMRISKNLDCSAKPAIICQSITGLYERKIYIFDDRSNK